MTAPHAPSSLEQNKHLLARWFDEVWNQGRRDTVHELFGAQAVLHDGRTTYSGPDEFCRFYDTLRSQFSEFSITKIISLAENDLVCSHFAVECLHVATSKRLRFTATAVVRVQNGQFTEAWQNWDAAAVAAEIPGFSAVSL